MKLDETDEILHDSAHPLALSTLLLENFTGVLSKYQKLETLRTICGVHLGLWPCIIEEQYGVAGDKLADTYPDGKFLSLLLSELEIKLEVRKIDPDLL